MSNIYLTQPIRRSHGVSWEEEYLLGLIHHRQSVRVTDILKTSSEVMTLATTHKYLTQLVDKKLAKHAIGDDKRIKMVNLTPKGEKIIKEIAHVSKLPSLAVS
jgi:predicted transcriptional regulator